MSLTIGVILSVVVAAILPVLYLFAQYRIPVLDLNRKKGVIRNGPWITRFATVVIAAILPVLYLFAQYKIPVLNLNRKKGVIRNGPWTTRFATGSEKMSLKHRAVVAIYGLWALRSTEAVYFSASTDSDGNKLNRQSRYRIEGKDLDARWWSITVYNNNQFIPNAQYRYSYSMTNLERETDGSWKIILSADEQTGNWIPLGNEDGPIALTLRLYNPAQSVYQRPEIIKLPRIIKED